jgi:hypothetical protein
LFGGGVEDEPKPLIEFFGGVKRVTCPVDDPGPLTRVGDSDPVPVKRIDLTEEIDAAYYLGDENLRLVAHVRVVIIDHHLMRDSSGPDWLNALSKTTGKRVSCAAD